MGIFDNYKVPENARQFVQKPHGDAEPASNEVDMSNRVSFPYDTKNEDHRRIMGANAMASGSKSGKQHPDYIKDLMVHSGGVISVPKDHGNATVDSILKAQQTSAPSVARASEKDSDKPAKKAKKESPVKAVANKISPVTPVVEKMDISKLSQDERRVLAAREMAKKTGHQRRSATGSTKQIGGSQK